MTGSGYSVVGFATAPEARTPTCDRTPAVPRAFPLRLTRGRALAVYDDQAARPRAQSPPARPVEIKKVTRVVRRVNLWSLARCAVLLYLCAFVVYVAVVVGLWVVASRSGAVPTVESFIAQLFAIKKLQPPPRQILLGAMSIGVAGVVVATLATVVMGIVFNLISDVVGGVAFTVLEEVPLEKRAGGGPSTGFLRLTALGADAAPSAGPSAA